MATLPTLSDSVSNEEHERIYEVYRGYIEHEDNLINQRTTWLITIQSFLWATFGFSYQKKYEVLANFLREGKDIKILGTAPDEYNALLFVLAFVGLCTSVVSYLSVRAAADAIDALRVQWESSRYNRPESPYLPRITGGGNLWASWFGILVSKGLPVLFGLLWLMTLVAVLSGRRISFVWSY